MSSSTIAKHVLPCHFEHQNVEVATISSLPKLRASTVLLKAVFCLVALLIATSAFSATASSAYASPLTNTITLVSGDPEQGVGYDWDGFTLTLENLDLSVVNGNGIEIPGGSEIIVTGVNSITFTATGNDDKSGIFVSDTASGGDLSFTGDGALTIRGTNDPLQGSAEAVGIDAENGSVTITGPEIAMTSTVCALYTQADITIEDATIAAHTTGAPDGSYAIYSYGGAISMTSSNVSASANGSAGTNYAILASNGDIAITDCSVFADASSARGTGNGICAYDGILSIAGGSIQAFADPSDGVALSSSVGDPYAAVTCQVYISDAAVVAHGFNGVYANHGIAISNSDITSNAVQRALFTTSGFMTIDSSTVSVVQTGAYYGSGISSFASLSITNSTVDVNASGEQSAGIVVAGDGYTLTISNSTLIAQGETAGIVINYPAQSSAGTYVLLGEGMVVLEGGTLAYTYDSDPTAGGSIWSYSLQGSIHQENAVLYGASKRVVIAMGTAPKPVLPPTGDQLYLLGGVVAGILFITVGVFIARKKLHW